jgi:hypothetical protein
MAQAHAHTARPYPPPVRFVPPHPHNTYIIDSFETKPITCPIELQPSVVRFPAVSHLSECGIPHVSLFSVAQLVDKSMTDQVYLEAVPPTRPLSERIPVPASIILDDLPTNPVGDDTPGTFWAMILADQCCDIAREYLDRRYGNRGCLINWDCNRSLLAALRMVYEPVAGEDPISLDCIKTIQDTTEFCKRCEHFIVVVSRWARCSSILTKWIVANIPADNQRAEFNLKLYFPDLRQHNRKHYPPHLFDPGPRTPTAPRRARVSAVVRQVTRHTAAAAEAGYPANEDALAYSIDRLSPTLEGSIACLKGKKRAADDGNVTDRPGPFSGQPGCHGYANYAGYPIDEARLAPLDGHPPKNRRRTDPDTGSGGGAAGDTAGRRLSFPVQHLRGAAHGGSPAANPSGVLLRTPSELFTNNAQPALVASIRIVVNGTATKIMTPLMVYRDSVSSSASDTHQLLGIETVNGQPQIRTASGKKKIDCERKFYAVLFAYHVAFLHALQPDVTHLADRWSTTLIPDVSAMLQIHGLDVALDYLTQIVMQIGMSLHTPTYDGANLIAVDFRRDPEGVQQAIQRVTMAQEPAADSGGGGGGGPRPRRARNRDERRGERRTEDRPASSGGPAPVVPMADRPKPAAKAGAGEPTFTVTKTIRESSCANWTKGFPCAYHPCPYDHSK